MTNIVPLKTLAAALLVALGILLAACGEQGKTSAGTPVGNAATGGVQAISTATPDSASPENTIVISEATATLVASSDSDSDGGNAAQGRLGFASVDPCNLLMADEVKSAMGDVPFAPKPLSQSDIHTGCSYVEPTLEANSPRLLLSLDMLDSWEMDSNMPETESVAGIGDGGLTRDFDGWRTVWVLLKGKAVMSVDIYPPDTEKAKQLLAKAMGRLP